MNDVSHEVRVGRRERNMRQKYDRIRAAAAELFERGFGAVTTQEIADRADVAVGTVFRYAASKSELLLMVYNERMRTAIADGVAKGAARADLGDAVFAMVRPLLSGAEVSAENAATYQRELLFGPPSDQYRAAGLALIDELEEAIAARLRGGGVDAEQARWAALSVFASTHLAISRLATGAHSQHDAAADLRGQVRQILAGADSETRRLASRPDSRVNREEDE